MFKIEEIGLTSDVFAYRPSLICLEWMWKASAAFVLLYIWETQIFSSEISSGLL